jgi:HEAT repeat protein
LRDRAWLLLLAGAREEKPEKRMEAISALATVSRNAEALKIVHNALQDKDREVRQLAATTLGEMRSRNSTRVLKQALDDEAPEVAFAAARALWQMGDKSGRIILEEVLVGERPASRGTVSANLDRIRGFLTDPKGLVLFGLREGVGAVAGPYAMGMNVVNEFTKDRSVAARVLCANMLASERNGRGRELLRESLRDKNWVVRLASARALGVVGDRSVIPNLQASIEDADEKQPVKLMAAAAIINLSR